MSAGTTLNGDVKEHFANKGSKAFAAHDSRVDFADRSEGVPGGVGSAKADSYRLIRGAIQRAALSANPQPDCCSSGPGACFVPQQSPLEIQQNPDALRIGGIRELNPANAFALQEIVSAALTDTVNDPVKIIELDLRQTVFLDSAGLGVLIALRNTMGRRGGVVRLLNPTPMVQHILELTRMHRVLEIVKREGGPGNGKEVSSIFGDPGQPFGKTQIRSREAACRPMLRSHVQ